MVAIYLRGLQIFQPLWANPYRMISPICIGINLLIKVAGSYGKCEVLAYNGSLGRKPRAFRDQESGRLPLKLKAFFFQKCNEVQICPFCCVASCSNIIFERILLLFCLESFYCSFHVTKRGHSETSKSRNFKSVTLELSNFSPMTIWYKAPVIYCVFLTSRIFTAWGITNKSSK